MLKRIVAVIVLDALILFGCPELSYFASGLAVAFAAQMIFGKA